MQRGVWGSGGDGMGWNGRDGLGWVGGGGMVGRSLLIIDCSLYIVLKKYYTHEVRMNTVMILRALDTHACISHLRRITAAVIRTHLSSARNTSYLINPIPPGIFFSFFLCFPGPLVLPSVAPYTCSCCASPTRTPGFKTQSFRNQKVTRIPKRCKKIAYSCGVTTHDKEMT